MTPGWKPLTWHPKPRLTPLLPFLLQTYQGVVRVGMAGWVEPDGRFQLRLQSIIKADRNWSSLMDGGRIFVWAASHSTLLL